MNNVIIRSKDELPLVLDVKDIKNILGIGINQTYELINSNQFHYVKVGKRIKVSKNEFFKWLENETKTTY
ncbi:helix-turn-helix domain-containing protein [Piscibacillus salipiscarius]|uniref:Helix-turn-helix domain-containing protein n=1 Tax=Piscibacillus salipiscarius TaxID=299480 RepID=A0ABW5QDR8_9BACI|nr:helix-turn-helix domain-containing protein [Piscibacillus salipiscarius]